MDRKNRSLFTLSPKLLAEASRKHWAKFAPFCSDHVFDGLKQKGLYGEEDTTNPVNQYDRSKLGCEEAV